MDLFDTIHVPSDTRPVLLGMNNPLSSDPTHALYPYPPGCTGHRLFEMLKLRVPDVMRHEYLSTFDRRNLVAGLNWSAEQARERAAALTGELRGREVVVLGAGPRAALRLPELLIEPQAMYGVTWRQIPHPSGRNTWYNDERNRMLVAVLLEQLYRSVHAAMETMPCKP